MDLLYMSFIYLILRVQEHSLAILRRNNFGMVSEFTCPEIKGLQRRTSSEIVGYFKGRSKLQASEQTSVVCSVHGGNSADFHKHKRVKQKKP